MGVTRASCISIVTAITILGAVAARVSADPPPESGDPIKFDRGLATGDWPDAVDIEVPPAPRDGEPHVALVANHNTHDGPLGSGWALVATSAITRHSLYGGVPNYTADTYRIDGTKLYSVTTPGPTHYEPETWDGSRYDYDTPSNTWTRKRDGWTWIYGSKAGTGVNATRLLATGTVYLPWGGTGLAPSCLTALCKTAAWELSKVTDPFGNVTTYDYTLPSVPTLLQTLYPWTTTGDTLLSTITYDAGLAKIAFVYADRPEPRFSVEDGRTTLEAKRLSEITVKYNNLWYSHYAIQYEDQGTSTILPAPLTDCDGVPVVSDLAPSRSLIRKIFQLPTTGGGARPLRCITSNHEDVTWDDDDEAKRLTVIAPPTSYADPTHDVAIPITVNLDGDGVDDLIVLGIHVSGITFFVDHHAYVATPNIDRGFAPATAGGTPGQVALLWENEVRLRLTPALFGDHRGYAFADLDANSETELLWEDSNGDVQRDRVSGGAFTTSTTNLDGCDLRSGELGDVNGDGYADLVIRAHPAANGCPADSQTRWIRNTGAWPYFDSATKWWLHVPLETGAAPAAWTDLFTGATAVCPGGVSWPETGNPNWDAASYVADHARFADFNRDGILDVAYALYGCWDGVVTVDDPLTAWIDLDYDPVAGSEFSRIFYGDARGGFVDSQLTAGAPLTLDTDISSGSETYPDRLLTGILTAADLDRDGWPELVSTDDVGYGIRAGSSQFHGLVTGYALSSIYSLMDTDQEVAGMDYLGTAYECYERTAAATLGDFDGDGFLDVITLELDNTGDSPTATQGQWTTLLRRSHRQTSEGRMIASDGSFGGRTALQWGFSASAPNDNDSLAANVEVIQSITGGDGQVSLTYSGAFTSGGKPTPFAHVERENAAGELDTFDFITAPWALGAPSSAARYRTNGQLEHQTTYIHGALQNGSWWFTSAFPYYNPLVRQCDFDVGNNPLQPPSVSALIEDCYGFSGTAPPVTGRPLGTLEDHSWTQVPNDYVPIVLGRTAGKLVTGGGGRTMYQAAFGADAIEHGFVGSVADEWGLYDHTGVFQSLVTPFLRWPTQAPLTGKIPDVAAARDAYVYPVGVGINGTVVKQFVEDWFYDVPTKQLVSSVEHQDTATTADDRTHAYQFEQPDLSGYWYRMQQDTARTAGGSRLWVSSRSNFVGFNTAKTQTRCGGDGVSCRTDTYTFSAAGEPLSHTAPDAGIERWVRSTCGLPTSHTDEVGRIRTYDLGTTCRPTATAFEHGTLTFTRDGYGRIASVTSDPGDGGAIASQTMHFDDALDPGEDTDYNEPRMVSVRDDDRVTFNYLDGFGRLTKQVECDNAGPGSGGGVFAYASCVAGSERTVVWNLYAQDGTVAVTTDPFRAGETPTTHGIARDGYGRPIVELEPANIEGGPAWNTTTYHRGPGFLDTVDPTSRMAKLTFTTIHREMANAGAVRWTDDRDAAGKVYRRTDPSGSATELTYDGVGNLQVEVRDSPVSCVTAAGAITNCTWTHQYTGYDAVGRVLTEVLPDGVIASYTYDKLGRRLTATVGGAVVETRTYRKATAARPADITITDRSGAPQVSVRDGFDREVSETVAGETRSQRWGTGDQVIEITDHNGRSTELIYDVHGDLIQIDSPEDGLTTIAYDGGGRPITITDADGAIERRQYTYSGLVARHTLGDTWTVLERGYDTVGRATSGLDAGVRWSATWDAQDRPDLLQDGLDANGVPELTVDLAFDAGDRMTDRTVTSRTGSTTSAHFTYDALGRLASMTPVTSQSAVWTYDRDILGAVRFTHDSAGYTSETRYDTWGRVVAEQVPGGWEYTAYTHGASYGGLQHLLQIDRWDAEDAATSGKTSTTYLDALGREIATIDHSDTAHESTWVGDELASEVWSTATGAAREIDYHYDDTTGRLEQIDGPYAPGDIAIDTVGYTYTAAGRVLSHVAPEQTTTFGYDRGLRVTEAWDDQVKTIVRGSTTAVWPTRIDIAGTGGAIRSQSVVRDGMGRITQSTTTAPGQDMVMVSHIGFDAFGNVGTETRRVGGVVESTTAWTYGPFGRPTKRVVTTTGDVATTTWSWKTDGAIAEVKTPSGQRIAYDYGPTFDHLIDRVYDPSGAHADYATVISRNLRGQITELDQPIDGTTRDIAYDDAGRVVARSSGPSGGIPLLDWTGTYDGLGRLTSETVYSNGTGWTDQYNYDGRGRLAWEQRGPAGEQRRYTWSRGGNLLATEIDAGSGYSPAMSATYSGQQLVDVDGIAVVHDAWQATTLDQRGDAIAYTADGEARTITGPGATPVTIVRDAGGLPIRHDEGGGMSRRVVYALDPAAPPIEVRESDGDFDTYVPGLDQILGELHNGVFVNAETSHTNALQLFGAELLDPPSGFGDGVEPPTASLDERFLFGGLEAVKGAPGLHLARHRVYDAATGRFGSPDPIGLRGGANRYRYAEGDPINGVDPMGWDTCTLTLAGSPPTINAALPEITIDTMGSGFNDPFQSEFVQNFLLGEALRAMAESMTFDLGAGDGCPPGQICEEFPGGDDPIAGGAPGESFTSAFASDASDRKERREQRRDQRQKDKEAYREAVKQWKEGRFNWAAAYDCRDFFACDPRPKRRDFRHDPGTTEHTGDDEDDGGGGIHINIGGGGGEPPRPSFPEQRLEDAAATSPESAQQVVAPRPATPTATETLMIQVDGIRGHQQIHEDRPFTYTPDPPLIHDDPPPATTAEPSGGGAKSRPCTGDDRICKGGLTAEQVAAIDALHGSAVKSQKYADIHEGDDVGWEASLHLGTDEYGLSLEASTHDLADPSWWEVKNSVKVELDTPDGKITWTPSGGLEADPSVSMDGVTIDSDGLSFEIQGWGVEVAPGTISVTFMGVKATCTADGCSIDGSDLTLTAGPFEIKPNPWHPSVAVTVHGKIGDVEVKATVKRKFEGRPDYH